MCGISGLWFGSETEEEILRKYGNQMSNNLYKRGPDSGGIWCDQNLARNLLSKSTKITVEKDL